MRKPDDEITRIQVLDAAKLPESQRSRPASGKKGRIDFGIGTMLLLLLIGALSGMSLQWVRALPEGYREAKTAMIQEPAAP